MPTCCTLGEAAGTAAALAHEENVGVRDVNVKRLQAILTANGAKIY